MTADQEPSPPEPNGANRPPLSLRKKTGFVVLMLVIVLAGGECFCRIAGIGFYPSFVERPFRRAEHVNDAWSHVFRGQNPTPANRLGKFRVICMGDSCTYGHGIHDDDATYPAQLEEMLRPMIPNVEVLNTGITGSTVRHGYDYLRSRMLAYDPKAVVVAYGWNDHTVFDAAEALRRAVALSSREGIGGALVRRSHLMQVVAKCVFALRLGAALDDAEKDARKVPLHDYRRTLQALVKAARARNVRVVVVTLAGAPTTDQGVFQLYGPSDARLRWHAKYVEATRETALRAGAILVDAARVFGEHPRRDFLIDADGIHPTEEGAKLIASLVVSALMENGVVARRGDGY